MSWKISAICSYKNKVPSWSATSLLSRCGISRQDDRDGHFPASRSFRPSCPLWRKSSRWHSGARPPDFLRQVPIPSPPGFLAFGSQIGCGPTVPLQGGRGSQRPGSRRMSFVHERNPVQNLRLVARCPCFVENGRQDDYPHDLKNLPTKGSHTMKGRRTPLLILPVLFLLATSAAAGTLFVSPAGDDNNPGTEQRPLATLAGARDRIRQVQATGGLPNGGMTVMLRGRHLRTVPAAGIDKTRQWTEERPNRLSPLRRRIRQNRGRTRGDRMETGDRPDCVSTP